ncbi:hypothetical protein [Microtetraspora sp. NBRC 13810]|uniref:hypothetical protein n=1 Tax=Microtetraspora sp. NBRC 13810 TaxID=3030990 RepID=UPI0025544329|nr:hypothetical protein [Microtetraspora sp. NBRC 13810]
MSKPQILDDLQPVFPDWVIWRSSAGQPWATRRRHLTDDERNLGLVPTITGQDMQQLVEALREQERQPAMSSLT